MKKLALALTAILTLTPSAGAATQAQRLNHLERQVRALTAHVKIVDKHEKTLRARLFYTRLDLKDARGTIYDVENVIAQCFGESLKIYRGDGGFLISGEILPPWDPPVYDVALVSRYCMDARYFATVNAAEKVKRLNPFK